MQFKEIVWNGFSGVEFEFMGRAASVIFPSAAANGKWLLKTEYKDAFVETELEFLRRGWHVAFNQNLNRWATDEDLQRKVEFVNFVSDSFGLSESFVPFGMSCGGMYAVKLAALIPEKIDAIYLDAPVMNLCSCPAGLGKATDALFDEFYSYTRISKSELLSYRENPIDKMHILLAKDIPIVLVAGDSDDVVPYDENGAILERFYKKNGGRICVHLKNGCGHHPHGLVDFSTAVCEIEDFCNDSKG